MLRILAIAALLVVIGAAYFVFGRDGASKSSPASTQGSDKTGTARTGATGALPPAPVRMSADEPTKASPEPTGDLSLNDAFDVEKIDTEFSSERSTMIRSVVESLVKDEEGAAKLQSLECRTRHCLLKISGENQKSVVALLGALQDERGFLGKAESLMMSREGDTFALYLRFAE